MLSKIYSSALSGLDAFIVEIEVDLQRGLPRTEIVGLPDATVREARERNRSFYEISYGGRIFGEDALYFTVHKSTCCQSTGRIIKVYPVPLAASAIIYQMYNVEFSLSNNILRPIAVLSPWLKHIKSLHYPINLKGFKGIT